MKLYQVSDGYEYWSELYCSACHHSMPVADAPTGSDLTHEAISQRPPFVNVEIEG
jgi:hypothetical protein